MALPNQRLGEYILIDRIGQGAFGEVWRARHHAWADRLVAIKIPSDPQYVRNLQQEGHAVHHLSHRCIAKAISFDPYADPPYLVTEYVPGWSLRHFIQRGPMKAEDPVAVMKQVLAALHHAHGHGVIHRDVKPENILVHKTAEQKAFANGTVKLTDFGLGKATVRSEQSIILSSELGEGKRIVGSGPYIAPEQLEGVEADAQSDLYACGIVLFEILTGKRPAGTEVPSELNSQVPPALDEVFRQATARKERRFRSAEDFYHALERAISAPPLPQAGAPRKSVTLRYLLIGLAATIVVAVAALLLILMTHEIEKPAVLADGPLTVASATHPSDPFPATVPQFVQPLEVSSAALPTDSSRSVDPLPTQPPKFTRPQKPILPSDPLPASAPQSVQPQDVIPGALTPKQSRSVDPPPTRSSKAPPSQMKRTPESDNSPPDDASTRAAPLPPLDDNLGAPVPAAELRGKLGPDELELVAGLHFGKLGLPDRRGLTYFHVDAEIDNESPKGRVEGELSVVGRVLCVDADGRSNVTKYTAKFDLGQKGIQSVGLGPRALYLGKIKTRNNGDERPKNVYMEFRFRDVVFYRQFINEPGSDPWWSNDDLVIHEDLR